MAALRGRLIEEVQKFGAEEWPLPARDDGFSAPCHRAIRVAHSHNDSGCSNWTLDDGAHLAAELLLGLPQIEVDLHAVPEFRRSAEGLGQSQSHLWADAGGPVQQARERHAADSQAFGRIRDADLAQGRIEPDLPRGEICENSAALPSESAARSGSGVEASASIG